MPDLPSATALADSERFGSGRSRPNTDGSDETSLQVIPSNEDHIRATEGVEWSESEGGQP